MRTLSKIFVLVSFFLIISSCKKEIEEPVDMLKVGVNNVTFTNTKNTKNIAVKSNIDWKVSVSNDAKKWLTANRKGDLLEISVSENKNETRTGTITVSGKQESQTIKVKQIGITPTITVTSDNFTVKGKGKDISFEVISNVEYEVSLSEKVGWITKKSEEKDPKDKTKTSFTYTVNWNSGKERTIDIIFKQKNGSVSKKITIKQQEQKGYDANSEGAIKDDIKVPVSSGTASSYHGENNIDKSFDENYETLYHSNWNNSSTNYFPITLNYNFENQKVIDYIVYHPRKNGNDNGNFKEVEIWASTTDNSTFTKVKNYTFDGSKTPQRIVFETPIKNPKTIRFIIKSGAGDGQGFASCSEMEFYQKNTDNADTSSIFTDETCSELKSGITEKDINNISNVLYKSIAYYMFKKEYPREFRIQEYKAYSSPAPDASTNKNNGYNWLDNPTGISVQTNEELIVFVGECPTTISLKVQNLDKPGGDGYGGDSYPLSQGVNKIKILNKGLVYLMYHTPNYKDAPKVKVHFATGTVNGYFDLAKHKSSDWKRLLSKATDKNFDVLGKHAHLTFPTDAFRKYAMDTGVELIKQFDKLVKDERDFLGLYKYNRTPANRAYFHVVYKGFMYAISWKTAYNATTLKDILRLNEQGMSPWGPAHELGHVHQIRRGITWIGMTEVSNNIFAEYIQTKWNRGSRINDEDLSKEGFSNRYEKAYYYAFTKKQPHIAIGNTQSKQDFDLTIKKDGKWDSFCKLVPFWQLQLYFGKAKGNDDFYKDLFEKLRLQNESGISEGQLQLNFVKYVCEMAQMNLIEFFKDWGFLQAIDEKAEDYGKAQFTITQSDIDNLIQEINSKNYPKPDGAMKYICDANWELFKNQATMVKGTASRSGKQFTMKGWQNVVAYEVWENDTLVYTSNKSSFTTKDTVSSDVKVYAVAYNGDKIEVVF